MIVSSKVTQHYKQVLIVDYLADRFTYRQREEWLDFVQNGRISVNNKISTPTTLVTQGDLVRCDLPDPPIPADVNMDYTIIYEDEWLIGVNKPGNLRVHDSRQYAQANLIYLIREENKPPHPEASLINRLDRDTSGVIILARSSETLKLMQAMFQEKQVEKEYLAVVDGIPSSVQGTIDLPIGKVDSLPGVYRYGVDAKNGKTAVTHYQTLQTFTDQYALLKLHPQTGRTHQLRVHLHAIGHPIVGDKQYHMTDQEFLDWVKTREPLPGELIARHALHCARTSFIHPHTNRPLTLEAPLPQDFQDLLNTITSTS